MSEQITANDLLTNPKYREMSAEELREIITGDSHPSEEYQKLCMILKDYGHKTSAALTEYYKSHPLTPKQMKKEDIKHPYVLVLRDGSKNYVHPSSGHGWRAVDNEECIYPFNYNEDLTEIAGSTEFDIMRILDHDGTVLWEREEKNVVIRARIFGSTDVLYEVVISAEKAERIKKIIGEV